MKPVYHLSNLSKRHSWNQYWKANNEMPPYKYHHILKKQRKKKNLKYNNSTWKIFPSPSPSPAHIYTNLLTNEGILRSYINLNYFRLETQLLNLEKKPDYGQEVKHNHHNQTLHCLKLWAAQGILTQHVNEECLGVCHEDAHFGETRLAWGAWPTVRGRFFQLVRLGKRASTFSTLLASNECYCS